DAMIHIVSLADGNEIKQIDSGSYIAASAAIFEGRVYVGNYDNVFLSADIDSDTIVWKYTGSEYPFFSSPAVDRNVVIFGGRDNRLHCVRRDNGKPVWTFKALGEIDSSPVICGDKVVVGSEDGRIYMVRLSDGKRVWSYEIGQSVTSSPAVAKGMVIVGSGDGYLYAFGPKR
ncbi:MAG: outer membrane protein assembly factor BamB family protein, partial [Planctomycetota bacterium]